MVLDTNLNLTNANLLNRQTYESIDSWRIFRIMSEFVDGFETLNNIGPSVSIFGSARATPGSLNYEMAVKLAEKLVQKGFAIITGGGPGIMEAANKGAQQVNGISCGLSIDLPREQKTNSFVNGKYDLHFRYFFVRKVMFVRYVSGFVAFPGGFGTLDEILETVTLIQTKKIEQFPLYLINRAYWEGLIQWIKERPLVDRNISPNDLDLITITDDLDEVAAGIESHYAKTKRHHNF